MARNRTITPDFWTWENVIDCKPMTRLLFIGLWNFADDGGVQPLKPRTIRLQVFPGDGIDDAAVRAMLDELAGQGLVRIYSVEGQDYVAIVDWDQLQRVGKRARRRYPPYPSPREGEEKVPSVSEADERLPPVETPQSPPSAPRKDEPARWRAAIAARLRQSWPHCPPIEDGERWIVRWIADGYDLERDVLPMVSALCALSPYRGPPSALSELAASVEKNRARRMAAPMQAAA